MSTPQTQESKKSAPKKGDVYVSYRFPSLSVVFECEDRVFDGKGRLLNHTAGKRLNFDNRAGVGYYTAASDKEAAFIESRPMFKSGQILKEDGSVAPKTREEVHKMISGVKPSEGPKDPESPPEAPPAAPKARAPKKGKKK